MNRGAGNSASDTPPHFYLRRGSINLKTKGSSLEDKAVKAIEDRITDLEIRYTHQEELVEALNGIIREQQETIDLLKKEVTRLLEQQHGRETHINEPPPHY